MSLRVPSQVGTDLRAVRPHRRAAFGEIALPRKRVGEAWVRWNLQQESPCTPMSLLFR